MSTVRINPASDIEWIYPLALILGFVALATMLPAVFLRGGMLAVCLIIVVIALIAQWIGARRSNQVVTRARFDLVILASVSLGLSGLYWYRVAVGVSGWDGIGFGIIMTLEWWLPAAAFAALYRHPGEKWLEQGRGRFFLRLVVVVIFSLPALPIQNALHEQRAVRAEIAALPGAVASLAERVLPDGTSIDHRLEDALLYLDVTWSHFREIGNYRQIAMLHTLAGDAGAMRPGGADRLADRANVDQVQLRVFQGDLVIARMDWPRESLRRGEQALLINYVAAGLDPFPTEEDLNDLLRSLPERHQTGRLCARGLEGEVWIGRCESDVDPMMNETTPELEKDWQATNLLIREISRVFPDVAAFQVRLAGSELNVQRDAISPSFDVRKEFKLPES